MRSVTKQQFTQQLQNIHINLEDPQDQQIQKSLKVSQDSSQTYLSKNKNSSINLNHYKVKDRDGRGQINLRDFDINGDGKLTKADFDTNKDGQISIEEAKKLYYFVDSFDSNKKFNSFEVRGKSGLLYKTLISNNGAKVKKSSHKQSISRMSRDISSNEIMQTMKTNPEKAKKMLLGLLKSEPKRGGELLKTLLKEGGKKMGLAKKIIFEIITNIDSHLNVLGTIVEALGAINLGLGIQGAAAIASFVTVPLAGALNILSSHAGIMGSHSATGGIDGLTTFFRKETLDITKMTQAYKQKILEQYKSRYTDGNLRGNDKQTIAEMTEYYKKGLVEANRIITKLKASGLFRGIQKLIQSEVQQYREKHPSFDEHRATRTVIKKLFPFVNRIRKADLFWGIRV